MGLSKKEVVFWHAQKRAMERFGLKLTKEVENEIISLIQGGRASLFKRGSNRITIWDIDYYGKKLRVVYDKNRHQLVTFLWRDYTPPPKMDVWERLELDKKRREA